MTNSLLTKVNKVYPLYEGLRWHFKVMLLLLWLLPKQPETAPAGKSSFAIHVTRPIDPDFDLIIQPYGLSTRLIDFFVGEPIGNDRRKDDRPLITLMIYTPVGAGCAGGFWAVSSHRLLGLEFSSGIIEIIQYITIEIGKNFTKFSRSGLRSTKPNSGP